MAEATITIGSIESVFGTQQGTLQVTINVAHYPNNPPSMRYKLAVEVTDSFNINPNIFMFESIADGPGRDPDQVRFISVATPPYRHELPVGAPAPGSEYYFLDDSVTLYYRSATEAEEGRDSIVRRIGVLLEGIEKLRAADPV